MLSKFCVGVFIKIFFSLVLRFIDIFKACDFINLCFETFNLLASICFSCNKKVKSVVDNHSVDVLKPCMRYFAFAFRFPAVLHDFRTFDSASDVSAASLAVTPQTPS